MKTNSDIYAKHVSLGTLVETGTCFGRAIERALELGYRDVRSVEAEPSRYHFCAQKFSGDARVKLWLGESVPTLPKMLEGVTTPVVYWLDAHPSGDGSYGQDHQLRPELEQGRVLRAELDIIIKRNVKGDVILIDDLTPDILAHVVNLFTVTTVYDVEEDNGKVLEILT